MIEYILIDAIRDVLKRQFTILQIIGQNNPEMIRNHCMDINATLHKLEILKRDMQEILK